MAVYTLSTLQAEVQRHIPDKLGASITACANLALLEIAREVGVRKRASFTTTPIESTGTVTATQDSTTVTGSGTSFDSATYVEGVAQIAGEDPWFSVAAVGAADSLELSSPWPGATGAGKTFELAMPLVTLGSDVLRPETIWRAGRRPLEQSPNEKIDWGLEEGTEEPIYWSPYAYSSGIYRIWLTPAPDKRYTYLYTYIALPSLYVNAGDVSDYPEIMNPLILAGTLWQVWEQEDNVNRSARWWQEFQRLLRALRAERIARGILQPEQFGPTRRTLRAEGPVGG